MKNRFALGLREAGPHPDRDAYASLDDYLRAFALWRAILRDARLTDEEGYARLEVQIWAVKRACKERGYAY